MRRLLASQMILSLLLASVPLKNAKGMPLLAALRVSSNLSLGMFTTLILKVRALTEVNSENKVVGRGVKAIGLVYHLTGRVPLLIKQSHLEEKEGSDPASRKA